MDREPAVGDRVQVARTTESGPGWKARQASFPTHLLGTTGTITKLGRSNATVAVDGTGHTWPIPYFALDVAPANTAAPAPTVPDDADRLVAALIRIRRESGLTQQQVADRMYVSRPYVAQFETTPNRDPRLSTIQRYARAIDVDLKWTVRPANPEEK